MLHEPDADVVWEPLPDYKGSPSAQALAVGCPCDEILFHGTRGPGKTEAQIAAALKHVGKGYGAFWNCVIFDRGYKNLADVIKKSKVMVPKIFPGAKFLASMTDLKWVFPGGEQLLFRHIKRLSDYDDYHGHEYSFIGFNELTNFPTSELYDKMGSCNRASFIPLDHSPGVTAQDRVDVEEAELLGDAYPEHVKEKLLPPIPLVTFSTTNPMGPGHTWVNKRFIIPAPSGVPVLTKQIVFDPQLGEEREVSRSRVHIFGSYKENTKLDAKYVAWLDAITDPNIRAAWFKGDWSITSGGALNDLWKASHHVLPRFKIPSGWHVVRSFDWGSSHPWACGFWAVSNGEEVDTARGLLSLPKGSLVRFSELYGAQTVKDHQGNMVINYGSNKGLGLSAPEVGRRIFEKQEKLLGEGWIKRLPVPGPADGQIFNADAQEGKNNSIAKMMAEEGIEWTRANKAPGSRKIGLQVFRAALSASLLGEGRGVYIMDNCKSFLATVPDIPRDEDDIEDVDTNCEDHIYDEARYMLTDDPKQFASAVEVDFVS